MNKTLKQQAIESAARFLAHKGYDILETGWTCAAGTADIVARDGDALVFVDVRTRVGAEQCMPAPGVPAEERDSREKVAAFFLAGYAEVGMLIRFDDISLLILAEDRALVRHHVNCLA